MFGLEYANESIEAKCLRWGVDFSQWDRGLRAADPFIVACHLASRFGLRCMPTRVSRTKAPYISGWPDKASNDLARIVAWQDQWRPNPERPHPPNWSVLTGRANNLGIIDIDGERGRASLAELEKRFGKIRSVMCKSGRADGGTHIWVRLPPGVEDLRNQQPIPGTKIDIRGWHGHAVVAGSLHLASGARYSWAAGCAPDEIEIAECPEDWWTFLPKKEDARQSVRRSGNASSARIKREHNPSSLLIGDGEGEGGFEDPIYKNAIQFFFSEGIEAPAEPIIDILREMIAEAFKGPGRDVSRYMSGPDLPRIVERARSFVLNVKEEQRVEFDWD